MYFAEPSYTAPPPCTSPTSLCSHTHPFHTHFFFSFVLLTMSHLRWETEVFLWDYNSSNFKVHLFPSKLEFNHKQMPARKTNKLLFKLSFWVSSKIKATRWLIATCHATTRPLPLWKWGMWTGVDVLMPSCLIYTLKVYARWFN